MDIVGGIAATSNAISILKAIKDADNFLDAATLKAKLAEVMSELADAKIAQTELVLENKRLIEENARLLKADGDIGALLPRDGYYYPPGEDGTPIGWPACPSCLVKNKSVVFLVQNGGVCNAKCPACNIQLAPVTSFVSSGYTRSQQASDKSSRAMKALTQRMR